MNDELGKIWKAAVTKDAARPGGNKKKHKSSISEV
jgi:hypothetical protein